jgi:hypothetical protein
VIRVAGLLVPALLVNAWFLLPEIAYASHTWIGSGYLEGDRHWQVVLHNFMPVVAARHLFALSLAVPESTSVFALPVLAIAWVLVSTAILLRAGARGAWMRALLILSSTTVLVLIVMTHAGLILALPRPYTILQFSFRLESYVLLGLSGTVLAALVMARRSSVRHIRLWTWTLAPVLLVSMIGAILQLDALPSEGGRGTALSSYLSPTLPGATGPLAMNDYDDADHPVLTAGVGPLTGVYFPPTAVRHDHASMIVHLPPGQTVNSNIAGGPEMVRVTGARIVGIGAEGNDVLEVDAGTASRRPKSSVPTETISLSPADSLPVVSGHLLTLIAVIAPAGGFVVHMTRLLLTRSARRAGGKRSSPARGARRPAGSSRRSSRS